MNAVTDGARDPYARFWEQLEEVRRQNPDTNFLVAPDAATPGSGVPPSYVYEAQTMLVHHADMSRIPPNSGREDDSGVPGLRKLTFLDEIHVPTEVDRLNNAAQKGRPAGQRRSLVSPNHLVSIAPVNLCPAGEPRPVPPATPLWPIPRPDAAGNGISVLVIDTGFLPDVAAGRPILAGVGAESGDPPKEPFGPTGLIKEYAGHGTFVAGVLRTAAPGVDLNVSDALHAAGAILENDLGTKILNVLQPKDDENKPWPQIISLSGGATSHRNQALKGLQPLLDQLATPEHSDTVLIAAAGNDGTSKHLFWPAAFAPDHPGVISVGALRRDGRGRACFSNHGNWVSVFAYGEDVINAFPTGQYAYQHESYAACRYYHPHPLYRRCGCVIPTTHKGHVVTFDGRALWNGTSFATPLVAGMVAAHMKKNGEMSNARRAAHDLLGRYAKTIHDKGDGEALRVLHYPHYAPPSA